MCTPGGFYICENDSLMRVVLRYVCHQAGSGFNTSSSIDCVF